MEQLLIRLYEIDTKLCSLKRICKENNLDVNILSGFNTKKMKDIYSRLTKQYNFFYFQLLRTSLKIKNCMVLKLIEIIQLDSYFIQLYKC